MAVQQQHHSGSPINARVCVCVALFVVREVVPAPSCLFIYHPITPFSLLVAMRHQSFAINVPYVSVDGTGGNVTFVHGLRPVTPPSTTTLSLTVMQCGDEATYCCTSDRTSCLTAMLRTNEATWQELSRHHHQRHRVVIASRVRVVRGLATTPPSDQLLTLHRLAATL